MVTDLQTLDPQVGLPDNINNPVAVSANQNSGQNSDQNSAEFDYKQLPHNFDAEQGIIGALLINNDVYERVSEFLRGEHFADPVHGRIYDACRQMVERGQLANPVTLKNYFDQEEALNDIGGAKYLAKLAVSVVNSANIAGYAQEVYELYLRRKLIELGEQVSHDAFKYDLENSATEQIEGTEKKLYELATTGDFNKGFRGFEGVLANAVEMAESAYKRDGQLTGLSSGLTDLDGLLGGLNPSDLLILAGRPSMGKTALATNVAFHIANVYRQAEQSGNADKDGGVVGFFSLEMSAEQLVTRIIAEQANITSEKIRRGTMTGDDITQLISTSKELAKTPLFIDDTPGLTVSALRTRARRLQRQHGLDMIVVDYLQLLSGGGKSQDNRVQEISEITRGLKTLAKELNVPVIALSQLSRAVEQREDKRPQLADLRESGSIEQDADVVMFVYRQEYYEERAEPTKRSEEAEEKFMERYAMWQENYQKIANQAEVIIAKQRHGPIGKVILSFNGATTKFSNFISPEQLPESF